MSMFRRGIFMSNINNDGPAYDGKYIVVISQYTTEIPYKFLLSISKDSGKSWKDKIIDGNAISFDMSEDGKTMVVLMNNLATDYDILISKDYGNTWRKITFEDRTSYTSMYSGVSVSNDGEWILAPNYNHSYLSKDGGVTFQKREDIKDNSVMSKNKKYFLITNTGTSAYLSKDYGETFDKLKSDEWDYAMISYGGTISYDGKFISVSGNYYMYYSGSYSSSDYGNSIDKKYTTVRSVSPDGKYFWCENEFNESRENSGYSNDSGVTVKSITVDSDKLGTVLDTYPYNRKLFSYNGNIQIATNINNGGTKLYLSNDFGETWNMTRNFNNKIIDMCVNQLKS